MRCGHCPVKDGPCIGETPGWSFMCGMAERGNPVELLHIVNRSAMGEATPVPVPEPPGLFEMARNFVGAVVVQAVAGMPMASLEVQAERKAICDGCEHLRGNTCQLCGCGLDLKRSWATSKCPDKRWSAVEPSPPSAVQDLEQGVSTPVEIPA